ncbi:MAG: hypothetical protein WCB00_24300 [Candidatus Acidiferrales bacterium]
MTYQKMKEMVYRTIYIDGWVSHVGVQTQSTRDLKIQTAKLRRLSWWDKINFLEKIESPKKALRLTVINDRKIDSQYKIVVSLVQDVFKDIATQKGGERVTKKQIQERASKFLREVEAYGKEHSPK